MDWDKYFLDIAHCVSKKSKDQITQLGAVIVGPDREIRSTGYNSFPRGINDNLPERQERPEKYFWIEHAERNAIFNAARAGISTNGCSIYLTSLIPCAECARAIINAGIIKVYCVASNQGKNKNLDKWNSEAERSLQMFKEANVNVIFHENDEIH